MALLLVLFIACLMTVASAGNFNRDVAFTFGNGRAKILNAGKDLTLSLDNYSGSGFRSKNEYLFGRFDMKIKLIPGNSAGTVTTYYLTSPQGAAHDEIDFEFLGNVSGQPYTVHTNVYSQGKGNREQQFYLWFNPTTSFHTYSIIWNAQRIIFLVDNVAIRVFNNHESKGVPFPNKQPMRVYASLWEADDWATQGGRVKTNWTNAPFTAYYHGINIEANCVNSLSSTCEPISANSSKVQAWETKQLDGAERNRIRWVQEKQMIYNYCTDKKRFWKGLPTECKQPRF